MIKRMGRWWWIVDEDDEPIGPYPTQIEAKESRQRMEDTMVDLLNKPPNLEGLRTRELEREVGWFK